MTLSERFAWRGRDVAWSRRGSGPPVVFCHGTPWSSVVWTPFARALASTHSVYLWDMPGYGASSKRPEHAVDLATQGEVLVDLLDHWGLQRPHLVAHDYGGAVALRAHLLHGVDVASLFLGDVVALRPWGSEFFALVQRHAEVFAQLPPSIHRGVVEAYIQGASHRGLRDEELRELVEPWLSDDGSAAFYRQIAQADEAFTAEFEPLLGRVTAPTHIVWGEQDTWIPVDRAHSLAAAIPGAELTLVPKAGHLIQYDAPVALTATLAQWLARRGCACARASLT